MQFVKVQLRKPLRIVTPLCDDVPVKLNEPCIVKTDRGLEYGVCVMPPGPCPEEFKDKITSTVLRKATYHDTTTNKRAIEEEAKAKEICRKKIEEHKLPMNLVDVEYTFDKRKTIFYFTADDRVDFRELVRDLAHDLKTRIELCHIQVRDEAKMLGGIGPCGQELCCKLWLSEFVPISMKMAKRQNLSLNPEKISGQCGRLMCCLSYEDDQYEEKKKVKKEEKPPVVEKETAQETREKQELKPAKEEKHDADKPVQKSGSRKKRRKKPKRPQVAGEANKTEDTKQVSSDETQQKEGSEKSDKSRRRRRRRRKKKPEASSSNNTDNTKT